MVKSLRLPVWQVTINGDVSQRAVSASIPRVENGIDLATVIVAEDVKSGNYPLPYSPGQSIKIEVAERGEAFTTISEGIIRFIHKSLSKDSELYSFKCLGAGYGLPLTVCGQEYGSQSINKYLDTLTEILTDANNGIIPKWVNKIMGSATNSGYSLTTTYVATISDWLPYALFPYKPCSKALDDLCDLVTAIKAGSAGPHWIVTPSNDLRVKLIDGTQTGWTKYYGNSQENATVAEGEDIITYDFEELEPEANYVIYYGAWQRPCNGDSWTENSSSLWGHPIGCTLSNDAVKYKVNTYGLRCTVNATYNWGSMFYPSNRNAAWDLSNWKDFNTPTINFYLLRSGAISNMIVYLHTMTGETVIGSFWKDVTSSLTNADTWYHFSLPIGPYYNSQEQWKEFQWNVDASPNWAEIDDIYFSFNAAAGVYVVVDGLHFGGASVCRVAKNSTNIAANKLKIKVITDDVGKDDSLLASDDSGTLAQMAYAELLRCQTSPLVGTIVTPMIHDLLPGQLLHIHTKKKLDNSFSIDKDMRVTKVTQNINKEAGFISQIEVTDDLTNSHPRQAFDNLNKVLGSIRPDYQDRQSASIKAGAIDIRIVRLEKDYPS